LQTERREGLKREDIEALKERLESDKVWAGNEVEKLRIKKEEAIALSAMHLDQAVRRFYLRVLSVCLQEHLRTLGHICEAMLRRNLNRTLSMLQYCVPL